MNREPNGALARAIKAAGGVNNLAEFIGVTPSAISQWTQTPAERVLKVEAASGTPRHELRPDIYPPPEPDEAAA